MRPGIPVLIASVIGTGAMGFMAAIWNLSSAFGWRVTILMNAYGEGPLEAVILSTGAVLGFICMVMLASGRWDVIVRERGAGKLKSHSANRPPR